MPGVIGGWEREVVERTPGTRVLTHLPQTMGGGTYAQLDFSQEKDEQG
ncbi:hypothetical protein ccbrp13_17030 [Ktedonobacteria bacterium brp13]|nr:hypothetical protein ccbrp13_17030 [Ktedonobacteria bacterium brp13]